MTLRYMKHAPEAYMDADAAEIEQHMSYMSGNTDLEVEARAIAARKTLKTGVRCLQNDCNDQAAWRQKFQVVV